jgi:hypothetical protein
LRFLYRERGCEASTGVHDTTPRPLYPRGGSCVQIVKMFEFVFRREVLGVIADVADAVNVIVEHTSRTLSLRN